MAYENYNIIQFMNALFNDDRSEISEEEFEKVYIEYIDTAGLYETEQFEIQLRVHYLSNRINSIKLSIRLQKEFLEEFGIPYTNELDFFKKFGHNISWEGSKSKFISQLERIEKKENKYVSELESKIKELIELKKKSSSQKLETKKSDTRGSFIRTLNSLSKIGYPIDKEKTTVEELAWMIKQQSDEYKSKQK